MECQHVTADLWIYCSECFPLPPRVYRYKTQPRLYAEVGKLVDSVSQNAWATRMEISDACVMLARCEVYPSVTSFIECFEKLARHPKYDIVDLTNALCLDGFCDVLYDGFSIMDQFYRDRFYIQHREYTLDAFLKEIQRRANAIRLTTYMILRRRLVVRDLCLQIARMAYQNYFKHEGHMHCSEIAISRWLSTKK